MFNQNLFLLCFFSSLIDLREQQWKETSLWLISAYQYGTYLPVGINLRGVQIWWREAFDALTPSVWQTTVVFSGCHPAHCTPRGYRRRRPMRVRVRVVCARAPLGHTSRRLGDDGAPVGVVRNSLADILPRGRVRTNRHLTTTSSRKQVVNTQTIIPFSSIR